MAEAEALQFIADRARQLNLKVLPSLDEQRQLIELTGGNPKALALLLGLAKWQPSTRVTSQPRSLPPDLLDDLFSTSWQLLRLDARQLLLAMTLFPSSVDGTVLATIAGLAEKLFGQAVQQLVELALLEIEQPQVARATASSTTRYVLHPLTRRFAESHQPAYASVLADVRERWLAWAASYASRFGY